MISAAGVIAISAFFVGFDPQCPPGTYINAISRPFDLLNFVLTFLGTSWAGDLPNRSRWPTVAESLTFIALLVTGVSAVRAFYFQSRPNPYRVVFLANMIFGFGCAVVIGIGRLRFGLEFAASSRYQTPAYVFWCSVFAFLITANGRFENSQFRDGVLAVVQTGFLVLMLANAGRWNAIAKASAARRDQLAIGWTAARRGDFDNPYAARLFYSKPMLEKFVSYLLSNQMGPTEEKPGASSQAKGR